MQISISKLRQIISEELFKEGREQHIAGIRAKIPRLEAAIEDVERSIERGEEGLRPMHRSTYPEEEHALRNFRETPEYFEMTSRRDRMQEKIEELENELQELGGNSLQEKKKKKKKDYKVKTPKHFNLSQEPGTADDVFHDCIASVKKSFKKHDYPLKKGKTLEDAAAAICTDSRKEGGATLDWGIKRKREVEKARPGGKSGYEKDVKSG